MRNRQRNGRAGSRGSALPHRTRAFTLAEVLISLALMALLMTAAALGINAANQSHVYNSEKSDLVAKARGTLIVSCATSIAPNRSSPPTAGRSW